MSIDIIRYEPSSLSDCIVQYQQTEFHLHKAILTIHCKYFSTIYESNLDGSEKIQLPESPYTVDDLKYVFDYCYHSIFDCKRSEELIYLINYLHVEKLFLKIEQYWIHDVLNNCNVWHLLNLACQYNMSLLEQKCIQQIKVVYKYATDFIIQDQTKLMYIKKEYWIELCFHFVFSRKEVRMYTVYDVYHPMDDPCRLVGCRIDYLEKTNQNRYPGIVTMYYPLMYKYRIEFDNDKREYIWDMSDREFKIEHSEKSYIPTEENIKLNKKRIELEKEQSEQKLKEEKRKELEIQKLKEEKRKLEIKKLKGEKKEEFEIQTLKEEKKEEFAVKETEEIQWKKVKEITVQEKQAIYRNFNRFVSSTFMLFAIMILIYGYQKYKHFRVVSWP